MPAPILAHKAFVRATVTNFFFFLSLNCFVLLPLDIHALGGTEVDIGIVMGLYSGMGIVCQPLLGPWVDVFGRRPFMVSGVVLLVAGTLLAIVAESIPLLGIVRAVQGVAFSAFFVSTFSYVVDIVPVARRGWALGIFGVSGLTATAVAPLFGEWLVRRAGFRALFLLALLFAGATGVFVAQLREARHEVGLATPPEGWVRGGVGDLLHLHMLITFFFGLGSGTIFAFLPTFAQSLDVQTLALFYTAYALAAIGVRVFGGRLIDTVGRRTVIVPSMFVQAAATGLLAAVGLVVTRASRTPVVPVLFLAGLMSGGAHGFLYPGLAALVTDLTPDERRAAVVGVFSAMFLLGQASGAFAFGWVAHGLGYGAMWVTLTALLLLGSTLSAHLPGERRGG